DTTTAEAGPPASKPGAEDPADDDDEDRTVQVAPVKPPRRPVTSTLASPPVPVGIRLKTPPPGPVSSLFTGEEIVSSSTPPTQIAAVPSTQPSGAPAPAPPVRPAAGSTTEASETQRGEIEISADELADDDEDDDDAIEDSITATAPRLDAASLIEAA